MTTAMIQKYCKLDEECTRILRELEKIQAIKLIDGIYKLDHAITATQKTILKSFGIQEDYVKERVRNLGELMAGAAWRKERPDRIE